MADELFEVRNNYAMGNYGQCIAEGSTAKTVSRKAEDIAAFNADRDGLVALAQAGLGQFDAVLADLGTAVNPLLVAIRNFVQVQKDVSLGMDASSSVAALVSSVSEEKPSAEKAPVAVLAAKALYLNQDFNGGLKLAGTWANSMDSKTNTREAIELRAIVAEGLCRLNRPDMAEKEVNTMKDIDDESVLTFFTIATVCLRLGITKKDKYVEAENAIKSAATRSQHSIISMNIWALALMGQGKWSEAEGVLIDALGKKSGDPDTLANIIVVYSQLGKPVEKYVKQIKATAPNSTWAQQNATMENRFAEAAKQL